MFSWARRRITWGNVAMTFALVFAMGGGAYAAKKVIITSTKQISPKVLKSLRGKAGPIGPIGPQGPQGPAGANGKDGVPGANGKDGAPGESVTAAEVQVGEANCNELGGSKFTVGGKQTFACNGAPGKFPDALQPGNSETGHWAGTGFGEAGFGNAGFGAAFAAASFALPLATSPTAHFIASGATPPAECPGSVSEPQAAPHNLCVFAEAEINAGGNGGPQISVSDTSGFIVAAFTGAKGAIAVAGSWAVSE